jgi:hypothetical protein
MIDVSKEIIVMQLVKYSKQLMLELATPQPRTTPLRPHYHGSNLIYNWFTRKRIKEEKTKISTA